LVELQVCVKRTSRGVGRKKETRREERSEEANGEKKGLHRICSDDLSKRYVLGLIIRYSRTKMEGILQAQPVNVALGSRLM
jgi:hypothetical protein